MLVHEYNADLFILRQPACTNYEKPFLYLLIGDARALLFDTGAGNIDVAFSVDSLLQAWRARHGGRPITLVVTHSHGHGDHVAGDSLFRGRPGVTLVEKDTAAVRSVHRLGTFADTHPIAHILGTHIENSDVPGTDYVVGTKDQPTEHGLALSVANLHTLDSAMTSLRGRVVRTIFPDFTIWPK